MRLLASTILAGVLLGILDCVVLAQAPAALATGASTGLFALAIIHASLLALPLAVVAALLGHAGSRARHVAFFGLLVPWLLVVYSLSRGHGISASPWHIPFLLGAMLIGALGLHGGIRLALASVCTKGRRRHALRLLFLGAAAGLYGSGFLYRESYEWLHLYMLSLAICSLAVLAANVPIGKSWQLRRGRAQVLVVSVALVLVTAVRLIPNEGRRKALLYQHTQAARSLAMLQSALGLTATDRDRLSAALRDGSAQIKGRYRIPACKDQPAAAHDVILLTVDALRADRLFGKDARPLTPALDALARAGSSFTSAYAPSPATSTSLVSILSGMSALGLREFDALPATLATELAALGYSTVSFQAFTSVTRRLLPTAQAKKLGFSETRKQHKSDQVITSILETLAKDDTGPYFFYAHLPEPHAPYQQHPGYRFGSTMVRRYDSEVAYVDAQIGRLVEEIERLGRTESTILAVAADHGEAFFEHGVASHGTTLYEEMIRVPLVLRIPGIRSEPSDAAVSLLDLAPTLLAGLGCGFTSHTEGQSLLRDGKLRASGLPVVTRQYDTSASGDDFVRRVASRAGDHKLILDLRTGVAELYDLANDPGETRNLIDERPKVRERLRNSIIESSQLVGSLVAENTESALGTIAAVIEGGETQGFTKAKRALLEVRDSPAEALTIIKALERARDSEADQVLLHLSVEPALPPRLAQAVTLALARRGNHFARGRLVLWMWRGERGATQDSRLEALQVLKGMRLPGLAALLAKAAEREPELPLAVAAATALCHQPGAENRAAHLLRMRVPHVEALLDVAQSQVLGVLQCLVRAGAEEDVEYLVRVHRAGIANKKSIIYETIALLGQTHSDQALPRLIAESDVGYEPLRLAALDAIAELATPAAVSFLMSIAAANQHLSQAPEHFVVLLRGLVHSQPIALPARDTQDFASELDKRIRAVLAAAPGTQHLLLVHVTVPAFAVEFAAGVRLGPAAPGEQTILPVFVTLPAADVPTFNAAANPASLLRSVELL